MKVNPEIHELYYTDADLFIKILRLLRTSYDKEITKYLIYSDDNYLNYLKKISLDKQNFWIFYLKDIKTDEFIGFTIFKKINSSLFLNQLIVEPKFQNLHLGKYLLGHSLREIEKANGKNYFKNFELEAFSSNIYVNQWYRKLGMVVCGIRNWYLLDSNALMHYSQGNLRNEKYEIITDDNNFTQLYYKESRIGTLINGKHLRLDSDNICLPELMKLSVDGICINSRIDISLPILDRSALYMAPFSKMINNTL